jgi:hypothetical protein
LRGSYQNVSSDPPPPPLSQLPPPLSDHDESSGWLG